jgi:hypothetical protein
MFLLQICGAFDAVAKVAHSGLGVADDVDSASWRKPRWMKDLSAVCPELARVIEPGTQHRAVLDLVSLLRNSVHESGLPPIGMHMGPFTDPLTTVRTPRGPYPSRIFHHSIDVAGGAETWGVQEVITGMSTIDPRTAIDRALVGSLAALNALMAATPVERFPNVEPDNLVLTTRPVGPSQPWSDWTYQRVLLLLGIRDEVAGFEAWNGQD